MATGKNQMTTPQSLFAPGATFFMPDILKRLPVQCHPDAAKVEELSNAWVRDRLSFGFSSEERLARFLETRCGYFACLLWPNTRGERIGHLANLSQYLFAFDDAYGDRAGIGRDSESAKKVFSDFFVIMEGESPRSGHPYARVFQEIWASTALAMTANQRSRYRRAVADWLHACVREVDSREKAQVFDFDTFLAVRRGSVWAKPCYPLTEHCLGIELPQEIVTSPELEEVHLLCVDVMLLINDLFSFPKEVMEGDYVNTVPILCLQRGLGLQQAVDRACEMVNDSEARILALRGALLAKYPAERSILEPYLAELAYSAAGLLAWSRFTPRYHGPGYAWNGLTSGVVTLGETGTTIRPA